MTNSMHFATRLYFRNAWNSQTPWTPEISSLRRQVTLWNRLSEFLFTIQLPQPFLTSLIWQLTPSLRCHYDVRRDKSTIKSPCARPYKPNTCTFCGLKDNSNSLLYSLFMWPFPSPHGPFKVRKWVGRQWTIRWQIIGYWQSLQHPFLLPPSMLCF